jgi:hypothetical protein
MVEREPVVHLHPGRVPVPCALEQREVAPRVVATML